MTKERNIFEILSVLDRKNRAVTTGELAEELHRIGIDITGRGVGYHLESLDIEGFTENLGRDGRKITEKGRDELKKTYIRARTDFIRDKIIRIRYYA